MSTVIDCPGDTIIYNCSILSNSEMVHLTWHVTFPGVMPINITYDSTSSINVMDTLDRNTSVILLQYEADQYIESVITFRLLKNISMNGTILLECGIAPHLGNDTAAIIVNTSGMILTVTWPSNLFDLSNLHSSPPTNQFLNCKRISRSVEHHSHIGMGSSSGKWTKYHRGHL